MKMRYYMLWSCYVSAVVIVGMLHEGWINVQDRFPHGAWFNVFFWIVQFALGFFFGSRIEEHKHVHVACP